MILVADYLPLVKKIAEAIMSRLPSSVEVDDLIQAGTLGLLDAIKKYDPTSNNTFKTYAEYRIRGAIFDELRANDDMPRSVRDKKKEYFKVYDRLKSDLARPPSSQELAGHLDITTQELWDLEKLIEQRTYISKDKPREELPPDILSLSSEFRSPDEDFIEEETLDEVFAAVGELRPARAVRIMLARYQEGLNFKEIGDREGVTESRVSQQHQKAVNDLKRILASRKDKPRLPIVKLSVQIPRTKPKEQTMHPDLATILTRKQMLVAQLLLGEGTIAHIARALCSTRSAVQQHATAIYHRTNTKERKVFREVYIKSAKFGDHRPWEKPIVTEAEREALKMDRVIDTAPAAAAVIPFDRARIKAALQKIAEGLNELAHAV